jgi:hypothetical protein
VQVNKILLKRKVVHNTSSQLFQTRVPPKDVQLKGKFHRQTQPQDPSNEEASKGCATSREETNHIKTQLKLKNKALKRGLQGIMHNSSSLS